MLSPDQQLSHFATFSLLGWQGWTQQRGSPSADSRRGGPRRRVNRAASQRTDSTICSQCVAHRRCWPKGGTSSVPASGTSVDRRTSYYCALQATIAGWSAKPCSDGRVERSASTIVLSFRRVRGVACERDSSSDGWHAFAASSPKRINEVWTIRSIGDTPLHTTDIHMHACMHALFTWRECGTSLSDCDG